MVQMSPSDQAIIKAMPGNDKCMECGMKSPQWASVSFGTLFCLECSGVHRGLGVHISFVRSVAMDSWTPPQLALMKAGGNGKCAEYLTANAVSPSTPIKAKYESRVAQHYKEVLKARVKGAPDPPLPAGGSVGVGSNNTATPAAGEDVNGMERLTGETDGQYVARQTRLREEARARMAAKFGKGGMSSSAGSSSHKKSMAGIGSDSSYDPSRGGYGGGGVGGGVDNFNMDSLVSGLGGAFSTLQDYGRTGVAHASAALSDQKGLNEFANRAKTETKSFWNSFSSAANELANTITKPDDEDDGLSSFTANVQRGSGGTVYEGFGSGAASGGGGAPVNTDFAAPPQRPRSSSSSLSAMNGSQRSASSAMSGSQRSSSSRSPVRSSTVTNPAVVRKSVSPVPKKNVPTGDDFFSSFGA